MRYPPFLTDAFIHVPLPVYSASGPMLQTCTLTFTPVTGADGEALVQEESACTVAPADSTDGSGTTPSSAAATDSAATSVAATSSADATETASAVVRVSIGIRFYLSLMVLSVICCVCCYFCRGQSHPFVLLTLTLKMCPRVSPLWDLCLRCLL